MLWDLAVIGAGINGASIAYEFTKNSKSVVVFDAKGIASGGSGAAGAFIAPKFSKAGELKELLHEAFLYSMEFYEKNFNDIFKKTRLIHIAKDEKSSEILSYYKKHTPLKLFDIPQDAQKSIKKEALDFESISIDAGMVDAPSMCKAMCKDAEFVKHKVKKLQYTDGVWHIDNKYKAKQVVLATGAYESVIGEAYIKLRGVWGHRIGIKTSTKNDYSIHQHISISPSNNSVMALGATHDVHYHPQRSKEPYDIQKGRDELLKSASKTLEIKDVEVIEDFTGLRSASFDYIPLIGSLVDSQKTIATGINFKTKKPNTTGYIYHKNLYMINGNGGYGFVLAPYLAKMLSEYMLGKKEIDFRLTPARFFARWVKRK